MSTSNRQFEVGLWNEDLKSKRELESKSTLSGTETEIKDYVWDEKRRWFVRDVEQPGSPKRPFAINTTILQKSTVDSHTLPLSLFEALSVEILVKVFRSASKGPEQIALALTSKPLANAFVASGLKVSTELTAPGVGVTHLVAMLSAWSQPRYRFCSACELFRRTDPAFWMRFNEVMKTIHMTPYDYSLTDGFGHVNTSVPPVWRIERRRRGCCVGAKRFPVNYVAWANQEYTSYLVEGDIDGKPMQAWDIESLGLEEDKCPLHDFDIDTASYMIFKSKD